MPETAHLPELSTRFTRHDAPLSLPCDSAVVYATYFDAHFLTRGLALLDSLTRHHPQAQRWVLCLDDIVYFTLDYLDLPNTQLLRLDDLEHADPDLVRVKAGRSRIDYYFTLTAPFLRWVYQRTPSRYLAYVDADIMFFDEPWPVIGELGDHSIGVIEHRYPADYAELYRYGRFNVGIVLFQRSRSALECLSWWRDRCIEWCYDRLEGDRYGEQKYLEQWPALFDGITVLKHPGSGLATWNVLSHSFEAHGDRTLVDGRPLVNFHFSKFKVINRQLYGTGTRWYGYAPSPVVKERIYRPYAIALERARRMVQHLTWGREQGRCADKGRTGPFSVDDVRAWAAAMRRGSLLWLTGCPDAEQERRPGRSPQRSMA